MEQLNKKIKQSKQTTVNNKVNQAAGQAILSNIDEFETDWELEHDNKQDHLDMDILLNIENDKE